MKTKSRQPGFSLITAIFLLVVVAGLVVYMVNLRSLQQTTLVYGVQGSRAMQAARAGIEWGVYEALDSTPECAANTSFNLPGSAFKGFTIKVSCTQTDHTEGVAANLITTYQITSQAESGSYPSLDYVYRSLQATVSLPPP